MQREIKFRGKSYIGDYMVYGSLIKKRFNVFANWMIEDEKGLGTDVITESIGQFTGLKDKNGLDIYEGDILKNPNATPPEEKGFLCKWDSNMFAFYNVNFIDDLFYSTCDFEDISNNYEIIGNIHQKNN